MKGFVDLPRFKLLAAQKCDAEQARCITRRIASFCELTFKTWIAFRYLNPFAINLPDLSPFQRLDAGGAHDFIEPSFAGFVGLAGSPHATAISGRARLREICRYKQGGFVEECCSLADGFADGTFAEIERPDCFCLFHLQSPFPEVWRSYSAGGGSVPTRFSAGMADTVSKALDEALALLQHNPTTEQDRRLQ
jgi:hypothetical protein